MVAIQQYTFQEYGETKWQSYGDDLNQALNHILQHPLSGHVRNDIPNGYLAWSVRSHIMIYRIEGEVIYLVRVLHQRMDFRFQF